MTLDKRPPVDLRLGPYQETLEDVLEVDALITDTPYSARTHGGHDRAKSKDDARRRELSYSGWAPRDVRAFVDVFAPRTRGWFVTITDHALAPAWETALRRHGRYVFAPLPWYAPGSRVRLAGDGPSTWACWIVAARPRKGTYRDGTPCHKWGTLPGGYNVPSQGQRGEGGHIGGKPLELMRALVRDYSRPGDLVCDPCAGYGTTARACQYEGRAFVGSEIDPDTHTRALELLARPFPSSLFVAPATQESLTL